MRKTWDFGFITYKRDRTFNLYSKIEDHANDIHDYLKYLKFGYGRATDDASTEIRHGRITREEGLLLVNEYDGQEPRTLGFYCDFLGISKSDFYGMVEPLRDPAIWQKTEGVWTVKNSPWSNVDIELIKLTSNIFSNRYREMYYNEEAPPDPSGEPELDKFPEQFCWL